MRKRQTPKKLHAQFNDELGQGRIEPEKRREITK